MKPVGKPKVDRPNYVVLDDDDELTRDEEAVGPTLDNEEMENDAYDAFQDVPQPVPRLMAPETHHYPYRIRRGCSGMVTQKVV